MVASCGWASATPGFAITKLHAAVDLDAAFATFAAQTRPGGALVGESTDPARPERVPRDFLLEAGPPVGGMLAPSTCTMRVLALSSGARTWPTADGHAHRACLNGAAR